MRASIIVSLFALSACATPTQQAWSDLAGSLDAMVGQPVEVAIARFGEPIGSAPKGADRVYGWGSAFSGTEYSNAAPGWVEASDAQGGVFPAPRHAVSDSCVIRMIVAADGLIRSWDRQGSDRGCRDLAGRVGGLDLARVD